ncbi:MAG: hypothetical protein ACREFG_06295 [Chthoniobacterales bacterium]
MDQFSGSIPTTRFSCHSFAQLEWSQYEASLREAIRADVNGLTKDYILGVDEDAYKAHIVDRYTLTPIEVFADSEQITPRTEKRAFRDDFGRTGYRDVYVFEVQYGFNGSADLFRVKPNQWQMTSYPITVDGTVNTVAF